MKIALVNPRVETYTSTLPPLGLLYIAAVLEQTNHDVRVFDPLPHDEKEVAAIVAFRPDVVGISVLTTYIYRAREIIAHLKAELPGVMIVAGGIHPSVLPAESLEFLGADIAAIGEGEITMREIVAARAANTPLAAVPGIMYRHEGRFVRTPPRELIRDLDSVPLPARHLVNFERYLFPPGIIRGCWSERSTTIITSRGCPYRCIFCGSQALFGHTTRRRSVQNVMAEIRSLADRYGIDTIWFVDDTFTVNAQWVHEFCHALMQSGIRLRWGCQARVNTIDEDTLRLMKQAGLVQLDFGVESGSDRVLKALKKDSREDTIRNAFRVAKKVGVRTLATFIFGNPSEEREDVEKTFRLAREINPNFASSFFLTPFPGTELMDLVRLNKWKLDEDYISGGLKRKPTLRINFTVEELLEFRKRFQRQFLFRNYTSLFFDYSYMSRAVLLVMRYPLGLLSGIRAFLRSWVFDDLVFAFLNYYAAKKQRR